MHVYGRWEEAGVPSLLEVTVLTNTTTRPPPLISFSLELIWHCPLNLEVREPKSARTTDAKWTQTAGFLGGRLQKECLHLQWVIIASTTHRCPWRLDHQTLSFMCVGPLNMSEEHWCALYSPLKHFIHSRNKVIIKISKTSKPYRLKRCLNWPLREKNNGVSKLKNSLSSLESFSC